MHIVWSWFIFVPSFTKISQRVSKLWCGHDFYIKIYKWGTIQLKCDEVIVLSLFTLSDDVLYLYQVSQKYLKEFQSYGADTIFISKFTKGHKIP